MYEVVELSPCHFGPGSFKRTSDPLSIRSFGTPFRKGISRLPLLGCFRGPPFDWSVPDPTQDSWQARLPGMLRRNVLAAVWALFETRVSSKNSCEPRALRYVNSLARLERDGSQLWKDLSCDLPTRAPSHVAQGSSTPNRG